ncbi:unnamed protein product [marine sediment metagenome]|uniref:Uncharacterized protein n=1 Tax=marine sediment metagenome TaxID=412755 RepID=X0S8Y3_9ZZZZ
MWIVLEYKDGDEISVFVNDIEVEGMIKEKIENPKGCRIEG